MSQLATSGDRYEILELRKLTGPQAGSLKYDLLTALSVAGLQGSPSLQCSMLRLCAMITARYNWRRDEISIGQTELARIWGVNERTVKREMKRLIGQGWLVCLRPGVRGRVGVYRLDYMRIYDQTRDHWTLVGTDYEARMLEMSGSRTVVKVDFAAGSKQLAPSDACPLPDKSVPPDSWEAISRRLKVGHPELYQSWFGKLHEIPSAKGHLQLKAPNEFVARYVETHLLKRVEDAADMAAKSCGLKTIKVTLLT